LNQEFDKLKSQKEEEEDAIKHLNKIGLKLEKNINNSEEAYFYYIVSLYFCNEG
jgi:predicted  nucleic acid-binding Zn-ribbon protein